MVLGGGGVSYERGTPLDSGFSAAERGGKNLNSGEDLRTEHGSKQGPILALTVWCVPNSLDGGNTRGETTRVR